MMKSLLLIVAFLLSGCDQYWECYDGGKVVAHGISKYEDPMPKFYGEGYSKLPDGRIIKGVCTWST